MVEDISTAIKFESSVFTSNPSSNDISESYWAKNSSGDISPIARGGNWTGSRDNYEESLFIATWGMDTENNYSPMLNVFYATIDTNDVMKHNNETKGVRRNGISDVMVKELQHSVKIYEKQ